MSTKLINVYQLELEADGSLGEKKKYIRLPPPVNTYILRFKINKHFYLRNLRSASSASQFYTLHCIQFHKLQISDLSIEPTNRFPIEFTKPLNTDIVIQRSGAF